MEDLPFSPLAHRAFEHHAPLHARAEILEMLRNLVGQEGCGNNETRESPHRAGSLSPFCSPSVSLFLLAALPSSLLPRPRSILITDKFRVAVAG